MQSQKDLGNFLRKRNKKLMRLGKPLYDVEEIMGNIITPQLGESVDGLTRKQKKELKTFSDSRRAIKHFKRNHNIILDRISVEEFINSAPSRPNVITRKQAARLQMQSNPTPGYVAAKAKKKKEIKSAKRRAAIESRKALTHRREVQEQPEINASFMDWNLSKSRNEHRVKPKKSVHPRKNKEAKTNALGFTKEEVKTFSEAKLQAKREKRLNRIAARKAKRKEPKAEAEYNAEANVNDVFAGVTVDDFDVLDQKYEDGEFIPSVPDEDDLDFISSVPVSQLVVDCNDDEIDEVFDNFELPPGFEEGSTKFVSVITLMYQLHRSSCFSDYVAASTQFCLAFFDRSSICERVSQVVRAFSKAVPKNITAEAQAEASLAATAMAFGTCILESHFLTSIREFIFSLVSLEVFGLGLPPEYKKWMPSVKRQSVLDAVFNIFYSIENLFKMMRAVALGVPLSEVVFSKDPVASACSEYQELLHYSDKIVYGLPVEGHMTSREFMLRYTTLASTSEVLVKSMSPFDHRKSYIKSLARKLHGPMLRIKGIDQTQRHTPYALCIHGPAGIGKSFFVKYFAHLWSIAMGRDFDASHIFAKNIRSPFWDGYNTYSTPIIHISEVGSEHASTLKGSKDSTLGELLSVIDSMPMIANMSAVEDKGSVYIKPELVLIDTNNMQMHADKIMHTPDAVYRRFVYVEPIVLPEFRKPGSMRLDPEKSKAAPGHLLSRYTFKIRIHNGEDFRVYNVGSLQELEAFFIDQFDSHLRHIQSVQDRDISPYCAHLDELEEKVIAEADMSPRGIYRYLEQKIKQGSEYAVDFATDCTEYAKRNASVSASLLVLDAVHAMIELSEIPEINQIYLLFFCFFASFMLSTSYYYIIWPLSFFFFVNIVRYYAEDTLNYVGRRVRILRHHKRTVLQRSISNSYNVFCSYSAHATIFLSFIATGYLIKKLYDRFKVVAMSEGSANVISSVEERASCGTSYPRFKVKGQAVWNTLRPISEPAKHKGSPLELYGPAFQNRRYIRVCYGETTHGIHAMGVCGEFFLINNHVFPEGLNCVLKVSLSKEHYLTGNYNEVRVDETSFVRMGEDLLLVRLRGQRVKDLLKHFPVDRNFPRGNIRGCYKYDEKFARRVQNIPYSDALSGDKYWVRDGFMYNSVHEAGDCGTPLCLLKDSGSVIAGIHVAAEQDLTCYALLITRDEIREALSSFNDGFILPLSEGCIHEATEGPNLKSVVRYEHLIGGDYVGTIPGPVLIKNRSRLVKSRKFDDYGQLFFDHFGFIPDDPYIRPLMTPKVVEGEYLSPWNYAIRKMSRVRKSLEPELMRKVVDIYSNRIIEGLTGKVDSLSPLTMDAAINGCEQDEFIQRVNASTAGGYRYPGPKSKYLELGDDGKMRFPVETLKDTLAEALECYENGVSPMFIYKGQLKDEPRAASKVMKGKTRIFYMSPLDYLILQRMFFAPFYSLMVEHGDVFRTSVGIDMHSQSDALFEEFVAFAKAIFHGDYGSYDVGMLYDIGLMSSTVVHRVLKHFGYNDFALKIVEALLSDGLYPIIMLLQDLFIFAGLQPSGKYGTAEDNSLRGVVMLLYFWLKQGMNEDFFDCVKVTTYGDDVIGAIKPAYLHVFNNIEYSRFVSEVYGMEFTSPTKAKHLEKYVSPREMDFLKRKFVYREDLKRNVGQLEVGSLLKALQWSIPSTFVTREEQVEATMQSVSWESVFLLREQEHFEFCTQLKRLYFEEFGQYPTLPSFTDVVTRVFGDLTLQNPDGGCAQTESKVISCGEGYTPSLANLSPKWRNLPHHAGLDRADQYQFYQWLADNLYLEPPEELGADDRIRFYRNLLKRIDTELHEEEKLYPAPYDLCDTQKRKYSPGYESRARLISRRQDVYSTLVMLERKRGHIFAEADHVGEQRVGGDISPTTVENLRDLGGEIDEKNSGGYSVNTSQGQRNTLSLDDFFSRPVEIDNFDIIAGTNVERTYKVWDLYSLDPTVRAKLRNYAYLRGNLHVRVAVSGTPFHYGRFLMSYQPYPARNRVLSSHLASTLADPGFRPNLMAYLSQARGSTVINVNENRPVDMMCPFISTKPMHRLFNSAGTVISSVTSFDDLSDAGSLFLWTLNSVQAVSDTPSLVSVQVYAWMTDVELGAPSATVLAVAEADMDERQLGPVEKATSVMLDISEAVSEIPYLAPLTVPSNIVLRGVKALSSHYGWSKPEDNSDVIKVRNQPLGNGSQTVGRTSAKKVSYEPGQQVTVDPRHVAIDEDDMSYAALCSIESYIYTFTWANSATPMSPINQVRVSPQLDAIYRAIGRDYFQPSPMSYVASAHWAWRGDINLKFEIVCSKYHRGKLGFYYEPNIAQHTLIDAALTTNKQFFAVVDIQETQVVEFTVQWAHPRAWARVLAAGESVRNTVAFGAGADFEFVNGYVGIVPFTQLQSPDNSNVSVNVYASSDHMRFNVLTNLNFPVDRTVIAEADMTVEPTQKMFLNSSSASDATASIEHFGEQPLSFRSSLKRFTTTFTGEVSNASTVPRFIRFVDTMYPKISLLLGDFGNPLDLYSYLRYSYLGMRGSVVRRFFLDVPYNNEGSRACVSIRSPRDTFTGTSLSINDGSATSVLNGTVTFMPRTNDGMEVILPYYSTNLWVFSCADDMVGVNADNDMSINWYKDYQFEQDVLGPASTYSLTVDFASGEDFTLMRFLGSTPYSTPTVG